MTATATPPFTEHLAQQLADVRKTGLFKGERPITTPQEARIAVQGDRKSVV